MESNKGKIVLFIRFLINSRKEVFTMKNVCISMYEKSEHDVMVVQFLMQHSSPNTTQRYLGVATNEIEKLLNEHYIIA